MKIKIIYIVTLVVLGVLVGFALIRPAVVGREYTEVSQEQLIQLADEYVVQFDIINHEGEDREYSISVDINGRKYSQDILVRDGKKFIYAHHVYPEQLIDRNVSVAVYKEGESQPFEQITYHLE